jgi:hypothetical protein
MGSGERDEIHDVDYGNGNYSMGVGAYEIPHRELPVTYLKVQKTRAVEEIES